MMTYASNRATIWMGRKLADALGMTEAQYRRTLVKLRNQIRIIENNLREVDYTFNYEKQPSKAMFKYRKAFLRHDGERYREFMDRVETGEAQLHTGTLAPYEIIAPCFSGWGVKEMTEAERASINTTWNALDDFGSNENAWPLLQNVHLSVLYVSQGAALAAPTKTVSSVRFVITIYDRIINL